MSRRLIVNADDYARDKDIDRGILEAHHEGIVTTTTAIMNLPGAQAAIQSARNTAPELGIGIHLNLTLGAPSSRSDEVISLLDDNGHFKALGEWISAPEIVPISAIEHEWRNQVDIFTSTGIQPDHLDSHHHIAIFRADVWQLYLDLAQELKCGVRPPYPDDLDNNALSQLYPAPIIDHAQSNALPKLRQSSIAHPNKFLASFFDRKATHEHLRNLLHSLSPGVTELMCHPGYSNALLEDSSSYARQRVQELEILTQPDIRREIESSGIELTTYQQAWPPF